MNNRSAVLLEFDKVLNLLLGYCISEEGKRKLQLQKLFYTEDSLSHFHNLLSQFRTLLESDEVFPDVNFPEIEFLLSVFIKEGTSLDGIDLYNIAQFINSSL
jgi:dsDNA-specific endonuclease/ATPase MutS2